jgi:hypothetical protein
MVRLILFRTLLIASLLILLYSGFTYFETQRKNRVQNVLNDIERLQLDVIQEYHAFRNLVLIDQNNLDNQTKVGQLLQLLNNEPNVSISEDDEKPVVDLKKKYEQVLRKKRDLLKEHEKESKISSENLELINKEYTSLLTDFQNEIQKLKN